MTVGWGESPAPKHACYSAHLHGPILRATHQQPIPRLQALHVTGVPREYHQALPRVHVPDTNCCVAGAAAEVPAEIGQGRDVVAVTDQSPERSVGNEVEHLDARVRDMATLPVCVALNLPSPGMGLSTEGGGGG